MKKRILSTIAAMGVVAMLVSCEKAPQAEIDLVKSTVDSAKVAGSSTYIPEDFAKLEDSLAAVMERVEAENGKTFPSYGDLKVELEAVKQYAYQVMEKTESRKAEIQEEIQAVLAEVATIVEENKTLITEAPKGKE
jgi:hypothetical protein